MDNKPEDLRQPIDYAPPYRPTGDDDERDPYDFTEIIKLELGFLAVCLVVFLLVKAFG